MSGKAATIRSAVREKVIEILELEPGELADATSFDDLGGDSVTRVEVIVALERLFDVRIPTWQSINSVNDLVHLIERDAEG